MSASLLFEHPVTPGIEMEFFDKIQITPVTLKYFPPDSLQEDLREGKGDPLIGQVEDDCHLVIAGAAGEGETLIIEFCVEAVDRDRRIARAKCRVGLSQVQ